MIKQLLLILFASFFLANLSSCRDEALYDTSYPDGGEGSVDATLLFEKFNATSLGSTRSSATAIKEVNNLCVLVYKEDKSLYKSFYGTATDKGEFLQLTIDQEGNSNRPVDDGNTSAESKTPSAKLRFNLESGKYYIYAVANMGDIANDDEYTSAVQTVDGLNSIELNWVDLGSDKNYAIGENTNNQMLGFFNETGASNKFGSSLVTIQPTRKNTLYCWLRRAASKITVAFDGTKLADNVHVYIKSVEIKDIPKTCFLGKSNEVGNETPEPEVNAVTQQGEIFYYSESEDHTNWPIVTNMTPTLGINEDGSTPQAGEKRLDIKDYHTENTPAFYFYENMQGEGKDKRQDADKNGALDAPGFPGDDTYVNKDNKKYGTYIEVEGYYERLGSTGKIIYRFMLGKDVEKDYNAERNFHYKLTLVFNGNANDADWHIEYKEVKGINAPNPYYISYLYHETALLPIELIGTDYEGYSIKAEIIENDWFPHFEEGQTGIKYFTPANVYNAGVWHGFLSLSDTRTTPTVIPADNDGKNLDPGGGYNSPNKIKVGDAMGGGEYTLMDFNRDYWKAKPAMGTRTYSLTPGKHSDSNGDYEVEKLANGTVKLNIPYYTRAKQLLSSTGYTGNNPFEAYRRKAVIRLTLMNGSTPVADVKPQDITIYQVRRCVNPKGVWRSWNNTESFDVTMMILKDESADKFEPYKSDGSWKAHILIDRDNMISLEGADGDGFVYGDHDTYMNFKILFNGTTGSQDKVRCAVVEVLYNNYTCNHKIFVRQGYAPLEMNMQSASGETYTMKWHSCNLYTKDKETNSPLEEGSLFKFGNLDDAIDYTNNESYGWLQSVGTNSLTLAGGGSKSWGEIKTNITNSKVENNNTTYTFPETEVDNVIGYNGKKVSVKVASAEEYQALIRSMNREFGYGVLYGDGAIATATDISDVYGYTKKDGTTSPKGMRGCFVYNKETGNQLFFPIGATGYGRRRTNRVWYSETDNAGSGALQYAWRIAEYANQDQLKKRPLFLDVYRRTGATYWCRSHTLSNSTNAAIDNNVFLDINFFTFDFNTGGGEPLEPNGDKNESSACFIRCVEDN